MESGEFIFGKIAIPVVFITEDVLRRYDQIIKMSKEEAIIRNIAHDRLGDIPVWKRRFGGNGKKDREEPARKFAWEGLF